MLMVWVDADLTAIGHPLPINEIGAENSVKSIFVASVEPVWSQIEIWTTSKTPGKEVYRDISGNISIFCCEIFSTRRE